MCNFDNPGLMVSLFVTLFIFYKNVVFRVNIFRL